MSKIIWIIKQSFNIDILISSERKLREAGVAMKIFHIFLNIISFNIR